MFLGSTLNSFKYHFGLKLCSKNYPIIFLSNQLKLHSPDPTNNAS